MDKIAAIVILPLVQHRNVSTLGIILSMKTIHGNCRGNLSRNSTTPRMPIARPIALGQSITENTQAENLCISWASRSGPVDKAPELNTFELPTVPSPRWGRRTIHCIDYNATYKVDVTYVSGVEHLTNVLTYLHGTNYTDTSGASFAEHPKSR